jgi:hypothetical protein
VATPIISATQEAEAGGWRVWRQPGQGYWDPISKTKYKQKVWRYNQSGRVLANHVQGPGFNPQQYKKNIGINAFNKKFFEVLGMEPTAMCGLPLSSIPSPTNKSFFFFPQYYGLNSGPTPWATPQPFLWWVFSRWGLENYLPRLASNLNPPDLCLLSS